MENRQISSGMYNTPDEFLTASLAVAERLPCNSLPEVIEQEQERQAKQKVNALLKSTLGKDRTVEATDEWWQQQRQQLIDSLPPQL